MTKFSKQPIFVLFLGISITLVLSLMTYFDLKKNTALRFETNAMMHTRVLQNSINELQIIMGSLNDSIVSTQPLTDVKFNLFASTLLAKYPYIKNISFVDFLTDKNKNASEMSVIFMEPYEAKYSIDKKEYNKLFYLSAIKESKEALKPSTTHFFKLLDTNSKREEIVFMVWFPINQNIITIEDSMLKGNKSLPGFVGITINLNDFIFNSFEKSGINNSSVSLKIQDDSDFNKNSFYKEEGFMEDENNFTSSLSFVNNNWTLTFSDNLNKNFNKNPVIITSLSGLFITLFLTLFLNNRQILLKKQIIEQENIKKSVEQQELLDKLSEQSERLNNIVEVQSELTQNELNLHTFMHFAAARLMSLTKAQGAMIEIEKENHTVVVAVVGTALPYLGLEIPKANTLTGLCLATKTTQLSNNCFEDSNVDIELAKKLNAQCLIVVPLLYNGETIGVCKIMSSEKNSFTEKDIQTLKVFAHLVGTAIQQRKDKEINEDLISKLKQVANDLFKEKELAQVTLKAIGDGVIVTDIHGHVNYLNPVAENLTGWTTEEAKGQSILDVFNIIEETTHNSVTCPIFKALESKKMVEVNKHSLLVHKNKTLCAIDDSAAPIFDFEGNNIGAVLFFRDVSHERKLVNEISYQAKHDTLTGLYNRREFNNKINLALQNYQQCQDDSTILYLDLDQFKIVNDTCGHHAGDELLLQISTLFKNHVRTSDTISRLGGDEFGILLEKCPSDVAYNIAEKIREAIQNYRFSFEGQLFTVGVSIGLVSFSSDDFNLKTLLSAADSACYIAKEKGRNQVCVFKPDAVELQQRSNQMSWVGKIQRALAEDLFVLYAQPIVGIANGKNQTTHYEMLIRMKDEEGKIISPMAFIPSAERYQLMPTIDKWVLKESFEFSKKHPSVICSINLSGQSMGDDKFLAYVLEQIKLLQINPSSICFEITETAAIANFNQASSFIQELKKLGCLFALDDFGSGMSSFNYLKQLPVDFLKIDGGFIKNIVNNKIEQAMVESIHNIGHIMGLKTIAEFVENEDILNKLKAIGIDYAQGYGIGKPVMASSIESC